MKRTSIKDILWLFLSTRLLLIMITYISVILFPVALHANPDTSINVPGLLNSWDQWDADRFISVAQYGYKNITDTPFFPLFPLLIKGIALLCGNQFYLAIGMLISNAALLGALFVLYQLANECSGEQISRRALLYLCIFPTAFFFFASYNESLFLLVTSSTFLALKRQKWWLAGLLGLLAGATRSAGVLLIIPFLYEVWISRERPADPEEHPDVLRQLVALLPRALPIVLIPLGVGGYCIVCWFVFGNPIAFAIIQIHWSRLTAFPWVGMVTAFIELFDLQKIYYAQPFGSFNEVHILLDGAATLGAIALAVVSWRTVRHSYAIWITLLVAFMLISPATGQADTLQSNQRFILEMFPAFFTLAALGVKHPRLHQVLIILFSFLQAIMAALFVLGRWMV